MLNKKVERNRLLVICQMYWPDEVAVAQVLTDLTLYLDKNDFDITVYCSNHAYENTDRSYASKESLNGIKIRRIKHFGFGKERFIGRILDIVSFNMLLFIKMLFIHRRRYDKILSLTNPPLISFIGVLIAKWKKIPFYYWAMDLQPEISFRIGYLKRDGIASTLLTWMSTYVFKNANHIIALDRFMYKYINQRIKLKKCTIIPVWPTNQKSENSVKTNNDFIRKFGLENKTVIMYSGNHSIAHPLSTLLSAAKQLKNDPRFHFVFIGAGVRKKEVEVYKTNNALQNLLILPPQPRNYIHISLSAADLQVVILGPELIGLTHPSKIYTAMNLGNPILYIGPSESHVTEILKQVKGNIITEHGNLSKLVKAILSFNDLSEKEKRTVGENNKSLIQQKYSASISLKTFKEVLIH